VTSFLNWHGSYFRRPRTRNVRDKNWLLQFQTMKSFRIFQTMNWHGHLATVALFRVDCHGWEWSGKLKREKESWCCCTRVNCNVTQTLVPPQYYTNSTSSSPGPCYLTFLSLAYSILYISVCCYRDYAKIHIQKLGCARQHPCALPLSL